MKKVNHIYDKINPHWNSVKNKTSQTVYIFFVENENRIDPRGFVDTSSPVNSEPRMASISIIAMLYSWCISATENVKP